jgi:hypothetical protein
MVWLYTKWQAFLHPKQPHASMEFYDRAWLQEADDADRRDAILYLVACFVVFVSMATVFLMF